jgi:hypothetical protein
MRVRDLAFACVLLIGLAGCVSMSFSEANWHVTLQDGRDAAPLGNCSVTLVIRGYDGKEERFGPAVTDVNGECLITVPAHSRPLGSYSANKLGLWLEVGSKEGRADIAVASNIGSDSLVFQLKKKEPNQAPEPTPATGRGSS